MDTAILETESKLEVFIARQPIFDESLNVYAYELLFRAGRENYYSSTDGDKATSHVITDSLFVIGMRKLCEGKIAFINFTQKMLLDRIATLLPKDLVAVEILETVKPDENIIIACQKLRTLGYQIVLDDFKLKNSNHPLLEFADIIKVDIQDTSDEELKYLMSSIDTDHVKLLAEKVETHEEYDKILDLGYFDYFQGYFFCKPTTFAGRDIPVYKIIYLKILREVNRPDPNLDEIERLIKGDVSFSYKLIKCINSVAFGVRCKVSSIKHALILMGMREVRSWISLLALQGLGEDKPHELIELSIIRGRFAELLAGKVGLEERASDLFLMGLFSLIDAIVDKPLPDLLDELPINDDIKEALLMRNGPLADVYDLVVANEKGEWDRFPELAGILGFDELEIPSLFVDALEWTQEVIHV